MLDKLNMNSERFAELWPRAAAVDWTLERCGGAGYYVTAPFRDHRRMWAALWEYVKYDDKLVYVPNWFESEFGGGGVRDPTDYVHPQRLESRVKLVEETPRLPQETTPLSNASESMSRKVGWKRWLKSFFW